MGVVVHVTPLSVETSSTEVEPASLPVNDKVKLLSFVRPSEDEDPVSVKPVSDSVPAVGAVVSMVTVWVAVVETFPAASVTVARNR